MPKILSGKQVIKILCREFGFYFVSQKGILELAEIDEQAFCSR